MHLHFGQFIKLRHVMFNEDKHEIYLQFTFLFDNDNKICFGEKNSE